MSIARFSLSNLICLVNRDEHSEHDTCSLVSKPAVTRKKVKYGKMYSREKQLSFEADNDVS